MKSLKAQCINPKRASDKARWEDGQRRCEHLPTNPEAFECLSSVQERHVYTDGNAYEPLHIAHQEKVQWTEKREGGMEGGREGGRERGRERERERDAHKLPEYDRFSF